MSGDVADGELSLKTRFSVTCTVSINNKAVCVHDLEWKRCKVSLESLKLCQYWIPEKQEGYTVPDFVRQIKTAWKKLNNITSSTGPEEDERE